MTRLALLSLSLLTVTGCVSKKKYNALVTDYETLQDRHDTLVAEHTAMIVDRTMLEDRVVLLEARNASLASYYRQLLEDFGPMMDEGEVTLLVYPDHTSLAFTDALTFAENDATLSNRGSDTVRKMARLIKNHPGYDFEVQGHTDAQPIASGPFDDNWRLGAARAMTVLDGLVDAGVDADRLSAATYAATEPLATNDSAEGRSINRRVEIALEPTLDDMPMHQELLWEGARMGAVQHADGAIDERTASR